MYVKSVWHVTLCSYTSCFVCTHDYSNAMVLCSLGYLWSCRLFYQHLVAMGILASSNTYSMWESPVPVLYSSIVMYYTSDIISWSRVRVLWSPYVCLTAVVWLLPQRQFYLMPVSSCRQGRKVCVCACPLAHAEVFYLSDHMVALTHTLPQIGMVPCPEWSPDYTMDLSWNPFVPCVDVF